MSANDKAAWDKQRFLEERTDQQSAPPIRALPVEIQVAIERLKVAAYKAGRGDDDATDGTKEMAELHHAIRAALDDEWDKGFRQAVTDHVELVENIKALRERCERLRRVADVASLCGTTPDIVLEALADLHEDDYADDLRPRGGDETS